MKLYEITIWKWGEELHKGTYQFEDVKAATVYEMGLFEGFRLAGKEPTGMSCMRVEEEPKHDATLIPVKFDYLIVDENNVWQGTGKDADENELEQDIDEIRERLKAEGEPIEVYVFKADKFERLSWMVNG